MLPFIRIPCLEAAPRPPKKLSGTEITRAHGQETTRKLHARYIQIPQFPPVRRGGITARTKARQTTTGVYTLANFVIKFSAFAFLELAFSTSSRIFATVESSNSFVTCTSRSPFKLMEPLMIGSRSFTSTGMDSPVKAFVSRLELPFTITPSSGTFSPGFMMIVSPISTSYGSTFSSFPSRTRFAYSGLISISSVMDFLDLLTA